MRLYKETDARMQQQTTRRCPTGMSQLQEQGYYSVLQTAKRVGMNLWQRASQSGTATRVPVLEETTDRQRTRMATETLQPSDAMRKPDNSRRTAGIASETKQQHRIPFEVRMARSKKRWR